MKLVDRLLTIVVTVTLTSAVWILIGSFYIEDFGTVGTRAGDADRAAEASPSPTGQPVAGATEAEPRETVAIEPLDRSEGLADHPGSRRQRQPAQRYLQR